MQKSDSDGPTAAISPTPSRTASVTPTQDNGRATATPTGTPTRTPTPTLTATATLQPFTGATYTYDGDGNMVKAIINGITTYYVSRSYQVTGNLVTKYYGSYAMRTCTDGTCSAPTYFLTDHLGSTNITLDANAQIIAELRYTAFGEVRYAYMNTPTDYRYTGQLQQRDLGLYFYKARFYDPALGRFISPDMIVPGAGSAKAFDRYAYGLNNPLKYTDPSGHCSVSGHWMDDSSAACMANGQNEEHTTSWWDWWTGADVDYAGAGSWYGHGFRQSFFDKNYERYGSDGRRKASNIITLMDHAYFQDKYTLITGDALDKIKQDPALLALQARLVKSMKDNPLYGQEDFTRKPSIGNDVTFGERGGKWESAGDELTWMLRAAKVDAHLSATQQGEITISYLVRDTLDLRPDWNSGLRGFGYNAITSVTGFVWHDLFGASDKMRVYAHWITTIR